MKTLAHACLVLLSIYLAVAYYPYAKRGWVQLGQDLATGHVQHGK